MSMQGHLVVWPVVAVGNDLGSLGMERMMQTIAGDQPTDVPKLVNTVGVL